MFAIKHARARAQSTLGSCPSSFDAMWEHIPFAVIAALNSSTLAQLVDALWTCAQRSKALAEQEVVDTGGVWDADGNCFRKIASRLDAANETHTGPSDQFAVGDFHLPTETSHRTVASQCRSTS